MNRPLLSILMTSYNREKYIWIAIESVLASTFTDFELIIVDDASTDSTVNIATRYAAGDKRIKLFVNECNIGDYPNRNKAADFAIGKYLKYVDSDDYIYPDGLKIMIKSMESHPEAAIGICSLRPDKHRPFPFMLNSKEAYDYHFFGPGLFHLGPLSAIFVKEKFHLAGGFLPNRMVSDIHMWFKLSLYNPVVLMSDGIVWARSHVEQELSDSKKYLREYETIKWQYLLDPICPLSIQQLKSIKKTRVKRYVQFILAGVKRRKWNQITVYTKCLYDIIRVNVDVRSANQLKYKSI